MVERYYQRLWIWRAAALARLLRPDLVSARPQLDALTGSALADALRRKLRAITAESTPRRDARPESIDLSSSTDCSIVSLEVRALIVERWLAI